MGKLNEEIILSYLYKFVRFYDSKKSMSFIVDKTPTGSLNFFRALGDSSTAEYISDLIFDEFGKYPSEASLKRIINMLSHQTRKNGKQKNVHHRVANTAKSIYVDMGNRSITRITPKSVLSVGKAPIKFAVHTSLGVMPIPDMENGDFSLLKKYIPVKSGEFKLILVFIFNCFFTDTHYVMLVLTGPAGSAKSFITKVLKAIIDPSDITLRNPFKNTEDLVLAALHCHLIDVNNCSKFSDAIQDALCTTLTGGVSTTRTKYTNKGETAIHTHNPLIANGIGSFVTRDDLVERALLIYLNKLSETNIAPIGEKQLTSEFNADLPRIMGGIFNALKAILLVRQTFETDEKLMRMCDFHILGLVAEKALNWKSGSFTRAYKANIASAQNDSLESNEVAQALIKQQCLNDTAFEGTYKQLRDKLLIVGNIKPIEPRELRAILDRLSGSLRNLHGIKVTRLTRSGQGSRVKITYK